MDLQEKTAVNFEFFWTIEDKMFSCCFLSKGKSSCLGLTAELILSGINVRLQIWVLENDMGV